MKMVKEGITLLTLLFTTSSILASCNKGEKETTYYTATFKNYDGKTLESKKVAEGLVPTYTKSTPTKSDDDNYTYRFTGWNPSLGAIHADTTYTPTFRQIQRCTVKWKNYDDTLLKTDDTNVEDINYKGKVPSKPNSGETYYYFDGWDYKENSNSKVITANAKFKECTKEDDRDYDGLPDYQDPTPLDNSFNSTLTYKYSPSSNPIIFNNATFNFNYKKMFVDGDNKTFNKDIAKLASIINHDSCTTFIGNVKLNEDISPKDSYDNIFERFKFDDIQVISTYDTTYDKDPNDQASCVVAYKRINAKSYDPDPSEDNYRDLFFVIPKYSTYENFIEWKSNIDIGCNNDSYFEKEGSGHEEAWLNNSQYYKGFYITAKRLEPLIINYINEKKSVSNKQPIVFLTGHSRNGSIANILGALFNADCDYKMFTYTLASLYTYFGEKDVDNDNIFNIINEDDFITHFPFSFLSEDGKSPYRHGINKVVSIGNSATLKNRYYNNSSSEYKYTNNIDKIMKEKLKITTRNDLYSFDKSEVVKLTKDKSTYISAIKTINTSITDEEIDKYYKFSNSSPLTVQTCLAGLLKTVTALITEHGEMPTGELKDAAIELVGNYKSLAISLYLNGLKSLEAFALPHCVTSYYLIADSL